MINKCLNLMSTSLPKRHRNNKIKTLKYKSALKSRQQAIKEAEKNRRLKYKAQDEEREVIRSEWARIGFQI